MKAVRIIIGICSVIIGGTVIKQELFPAKKEKKLPVTVKKVKKPKKNLPDPKEIEEKFPKTTKVPKEEPIKETPNENNDSGEENIE